MSRKADLIAEESILPEPDPTIRRSSRKRVVNSPYSQVAPVITVGRTRRNSTSSVDSVVSTNSTASLPVATKSAVRERRPSLSHESNLERVEKEAKRSESTTPVKRNKRDSIGSLQEDVFVNVRAGSPAVATMSDRRRTLRSASRSPTFEPKSDTESQITVTNETPSKIRGRRASAEKVTTKRSGSIALDVLDEEQEPVENPMELDALKIKKLKTVNEESVAEEMEQEPKKPQLNIDENIEAKEMPKKKRLSFEKTIMLPNEDNRSRKSSESSSKSANLEKGGPSEIFKVSTVTVSQKVREQILANPKVLISPLSTIMSTNNLNETTKLITEEDIQIDEKLGDEIEIHAPGVKSDDSEPTEHEKQTNKPDSCNDLEKVALSAAPPKQTFEELKPFSKDSPKHTNLILKSPIRRSPRLHSETRSDNPESPAGKVENYLMSSMTSSPVISKAVSNIESPKINTLSKESNIVNQASINKASSLDESKEILDGCDGSFDLSLKSSIMSSKEASLVDKSTADISDKENKQCTNNMSNESDENTAYPKAASPVERKSNVFRSNNIEESFFESMDVDYPSDNDESLTAKNVSMNKSATQITQASDESSSGSLHLMCSDDNEEKTNDSTNILKRNTLPAHRQSIALIELDKSIVTDDCNDHIVEPLKTTSLLDTRISILPCKLLTPVLTEIEQEKNIHFEKSLECNSPKSQENNSDNSPLESTFNQKETLEAGGNDIEANTFSEEVPEKELILCNSTENKDDLTNGELVKSNETQISPNLNDTFTKRTPSPARKSNIPTKPLETKKDNNEDIKLLSSHSDEEGDKGKKSDIKFGDLPLVVDSQNSDEKEVVTEDYDSYPEIVSDEMNNKDRVSDVDRSLNDKSQNPAQSNRVVELQSITLMSSNSSADQSSNSKDKKHTTYKINAEFQRSIIKSSASESSDTDSQFNQLILDIAAESNEHDDYYNSSCNANEFLDNEAIEVLDEDISLEDSNEICDFGVNIEDTDDEGKYEEEVASQSDEDFIDDDNVIELLSWDGNDNDLDYDNTEVVAKKKKRRILTRPVDEVEETITEEKKTDVNLDNSVNKLKKNRNSSISVSENIKKDDIDKTEISDKISDLVDLFCSRISDKKGGSVNVNMSLDYDESSSNEEESRKKSNISLSTSAINKSLKRKSIEQTPGACDSSTLAGTKPSKIKVLQEVIIPCNVEPQQEAAQEISSFKKLKKNKRHHTTRIKSYDDSVFLPDSSNNDNSTVLQKTPKPSTVCNLPANITSQLVDEEAITFKSNLKGYYKKLGMPISVHLKSEDYKEYYAPSTSHGGTTQWEIFDLAKQIKPSKHNIRNQSKNDEKELRSPKDFKNYMIAKNKPKVNKKSFKDTLKIQKYI